MMKHLLLWMCLVLLGAPLASVAEIYKWVDESGVTQFSQTKPQSEMPVATVDVKQSHPSATRATWQEQEAEFAERAEETSKAQAESAKARADAATKKADCEQARSRLTTLQRPRINEVQEDGTRVRIGEDKRQAEIKKANEAVSKLCN